MVKKNSDALNQKKKDRTIKKIQALRDNLRKRKKQVKERETFDSSING